MGIEYVTNGAFASGPSKVKVLGGVLSKRYKGVRNVTGAGDAITGSFHETGRPVFEVNTQGVYEASTGVWPRAVFNSALTGDFSFKTSRLIIAKQMRLKDLTGAPDALAVSYFSPSRPVYMYSGFGIAAEDDAKMPSVTQSGNAIASFSAVIYDDTTDVALTGAIKITGYQLILPFGEGGPTMLRWQGVGNTDAPTTTNTPWAQTSYSADLTTAGTQYAGTVVPRSIRCDIDYESGVETTVDINGPFSGAVTITEL